MARESRVRRSVTAEEYKSLHQLEKSPKSSALISVVLVVCIGLIVYSHVGLSAQVVTNAPPPPSPAECEAATPAAADNMSSASAVLLGGLCTVGDEALYMQLGRRSPIPFQPSEFDALVNMCSVECSLLALTDGGACVGTCVRVRQSFTSGCMPCIANFSFCSAITCFAKCITEIDVDCLICVHEGCTAEWNSCTGFGDVMNFPPSSSAPRQPPSSYFWNIGGDADIAFFTALDRLVGAGGYALFLLILLGSGVKPYAECIVLFIIWFVPLPRRTRGQTLRWLNRGSRWSLLDMLVVMTIGSAIHFSILSGTVSVILESRSAIYTFAVMACVLTPVGEWMTFRSTVHGGFEDKDPAHLGCFGKPLLALLDRPMQNDALKRRSPLLLLVAPIGLCLTATALFVPFAVRWTIEDKIGGGDLMHQEMTFASLMFGLSNPVTDSAGGGVFMAIIYFLVVIFAPLTSGLAMVIIAIVPADSTLHLYTLRWAQAVNPYSSLDVMLVSLLAFVSEFDRLIAAIADTATGGCPGNGVGASAAIEARATVGTGVWIAIPAIIFTWIAQVLTAVHAATCEAQLQNSSPTTNELGAKVSA